MIYNLTKNNIISLNPVFYVKKDVAIATLIRERLAEHDAIVFQNKKFIFTWFLRLNTNILLANMENKVIKKLTYTNRKNFIIGSTRTANIIFLFGPNIDSLCIEEGDQLNLNAEPTVKIKTNFNKEISDIIISTPTAMSSKK